MPDRGSLPRYPQLAGHLGLATLFLMVGGLRYLVAAGNRREMERGKEAMKSAVVGYVLAVMAPLLIDLLRRMVGI